MNTRRIDSGRCLARFSVALLAATALMLPATSTRADQGEGNAQLLKLIRKARVIDLSHTWDAQSPIAAGQPAVQLLAGRHACQHARHLRRRQPALVHLGDHAVERPAWCAEHRCDRPHRARRASSSAAWMPRRRRSNPNGHRRQRRGRASGDRQVPQRPAREPRRAARCGAHGPRRLEPAAGELRDHGGST